MATFPKGKSQGELDREKELDRRKAHKKAAEKSVNLIVHPPAQK